MFYLASFRRKSQLIPVIGINNCLRLYRFDTIFLIDVVFVLTSEQTVFEMVLKLVRYLLLLDMVGKSWHHREMEIVKTSEIHSTLSNISPLTCQLKCNRMSQCEAYKSNRLENGKLTNCILLKISHTLAVKTIELFVVRKMKQCFATGNCKRANKPASKDVPCEFNTSYPGNDIDNR